MRWWFQVYTGVSKLVSWCFTPSQPVRLYQGDTQERTENERTVFKWSDSFRFTQENIENERTVFRWSDSCRYTLENTMSQLFSSEVMVWGLHMRTQKMSQLFSSEVMVWGLHMRTQKMSELFSSEVMVLGVTLQITDNEWTVFKRSDGFRFTPREPSSALDCPSGPAQEGGE